MESLLARPGKRSRKRICWTRSLPRSNAIRAPSSRRRAHQSFPEPRMASEPLLDGDTPLSVNDAVAAIILVESDGYLLQLRDARPDIWYPDHWGLFGGGTELGEDPMQSLARELREELELELEHAEFFARIEFDLGGLGLERYFRSYYVVPISRRVAG